MGSVDFQNITWNHATETQRHRPLHSLEGGGQDHARHGGGEGEGGGVVSSGQNGRDLTSISLNNFQVLE